MLSSDFPVSFSLVVRPCVSELVIFALPETILRLAEIFVGELVFLCLAETLLQLAGTCTRRLSRGIDFFALSPVLSFFIS